MTTVPRLKAPGAAGWGPLEFTIGSLALLGSVIACKPQTREAQPESDVLQ